VYLDRQQKALASDRPLHAFWGTLTEPKDTRLLLEFMGLANHRKEIRAEIAAWSERWREQQITALNFIVREHDIDTEEFPPAALAVVIAAIGRTLILEQGLGTSGGHDEAVALVNRSSTDSRCRNRKLATVAALRPVRAARSATAPSRGRWMSTRVVLCRSRYPIRASG